MKHIKRSIIIRIRDDGLEDADAMGYVITAIGKSCNDYHHTVTRFVDGTVVAAERLKSGVKFDVWKEG